MIARENAGSSSASALDDASRAACAGVSEGLQRTGFAARYEAARKVSRYAGLFGQRRRETVRGNRICTQRGSAQNAPFPLTLDKIGAFPHERKPRVVYIGAREQGCALSSAGAIRTKRLCAAWLSIRRRFRRARHDRANQGSSRAAPIGRVHPDQF